MKRAYSTILLALLVISVLPVTSGAKSDTGCNPIQETEICIEDVSISETSVEAGNRTDVSLTISNVGNQTGDATVLLGMRQPEGRYDYFKAEEVHNLEPGDTQTVSIPLRMQAGEPVGVHELNIMVFDDAEQHLYDATGYYQKITVEEGQGSFNLLSWIEKLGNVAKALLAIIALAIFVVYRKFVWS